MPKSRVFFAIWPTEPASRSLYALASASGRTCGGRIMRRDTLHVTLAFVGNVAKRQIDELASAAGTIAAAPFELVLDRFGYWRHNRILWAGGDSPPLATLADTLAASLRVAGFRLGARPFASHLTLLRDANCAEVPALPAPVAWTASEFLLVASRPSAAGAHYEPIGRWPLLG